MGTAYNNRSAYAVDTNGLKAPNEWRKDRFVFNFIDKDGVFEAAMSCPIKVVPLKDNKGDVCWTNKCWTTRTYFGTSWLYN